MSLTPSGKLVLRNASYARNSACELPSMFFAIRVLGRMGWMGPVQSFYEFLPGPSFNFYDSKAHGLCHTSTFTSLRRSPQLWLALFFGFSGICGGLTSKLREVARVPVITNKKPLLRLGYFS